MASNSNQVGQSDPARPPGFDAATYGRRRMSSHELERAAEDAKYLEALKREEGEWEELASQRQQALRLAKREYEKEPLTLTYDDIKGSLTEEEAAFLAARPDYEGLLKKAQDAKNAAEIALDEKRECLLRYNHVLEKVQEQVNQAAKVIIDLPDPILDQ